MVLRDGFGTAARFSKLAAAVDLFDFGAPGHMERQINATQKDKTDPVTESVKKERRKNRPLFRVDLCQETAALPGNRH